MNRIPSFKQLEVWRKAIKLVRLIYEVTGTYPTHERFGLTSKTRKSARSIPANIAEGKMRSSEREFRQFVSVARGSLGELHTQILIAGELGYLAGNVLERIEQDIEEVGRMLRGLEHALSLTAKA